MKRLLSAAALLLLPGLACADAIGGVVQIFTRRSAGEGLQPFVRMGYGSNASWRRSASVRCPAAFPCVLAGLWMLQTQIACPVVVEVSCTSGMPTLASI
mgnify:CR=1 FL=1